MCDDKLYLEPPILNHDGIDLISANTIGNVSNI